MKTLVNLTIIAIILMLCILINVSCAKAADKPVHYVIVRTQGVTLRLNPVDVAYVKSIGFISVNTVLAANGPLRNNSAADIVLAIIKNRK